MSKQVRKSISALLVFVLVLQVFAVTSIHAEGGLEVQDKKITTKVGLNEIQLNWVEATSVSPEDLMYSIYMSDQANIDTVSNAEKNGTKISGLQNGSSSFKIDNLTSGVKYYFNIVASDTDSKIAYSMEEVSTLSSSAQAPSVTADDEANVIIGAKNTMEYSVNEGADWQDYDTTEPPSFNGNASVWVRVKASNSEPASQHKVLTFTENTETNQLDSLNLAKSKGDISGVLAALQHPNLGILLPQGFNLWSDDEKQSVAEFVTMINGSTGYVSKGQVQYALDIAIEPRSLFDSNDLLTVEQNITAYFGNLAYLPQVFGANTDESIQALYELGEKYTNLSSVEKQIFAYRIMFYAKRDGLPSHKIREQLDAILSTYSSINRVIDSGDMHNVLINLRLIQKESTDYNNDPDTIEKMTPFSLDLDKIDPIEYETEQELAQWMIDHRPETGYADYQAIQETFDAFFNPVKDPLKELNTAKSEENVKNVLQLIKLPEWLDLPEGFESLQPEEQEIVAQVVMTFVPSSYDYQSKAEVQYALKMGFEGVMAALQTDPLLFQQHLISFYSLVSQANQYISYPDTGGVQIVSQKYAKLSSVDKQLISYIAQRFSQDDDFVMKDAYIGYLMLLLQYPPINEPATPEEMLGSLQMIYEYQHSSEANTPDKKFPLDFGKLATITSNETKQEQLAQWMIDHRPETGYADYQAIQETFDAFFNPVKDPLKELNTAKSEENVKNVLQLIKLPEWLDLPEGFESLQPEEQEVVAYIVMSFASSDYDYKSKEEVQFAIEVGYEGLMAMLQTDPLLFQQHLNSFYSLISQTSEHMSYPGADLLQFVGQKYSKLSLVDKQLVSYIAQRISKDESLSMNDKYTIFLLLLMQYSSINEPATTGEMLAALNSIYVYQHSSEANTPDKKFPLDFGKLATITSNETKQEQLAQWMIAKKPVGGYTSYEEIQKAFNAFFAPPSDPTTPGSSTGSGSGGGGSSTPVATTKQEQIVVDVNGVNGTNLTKTPITRTTETNGVVKDLVKMTDTIAKQSVEKAKQLGTDTARIVIPDTKDAVSETRIEVPKTAVKELSDGSLKLEISTANAVISVPTKSIAGFDQDLYFRIVPLKKDSERNEVEERAKKEQVIQKAAPNSNVRVLARPVEIETNMQSREITLTLPLGNSLPTEATARQQALNKLAVYIEHSDGTKELVRGKLVKLTDGSEGIEFTVTKFSTFTLVSVDGLKATQQANPPYIQGFGTDFRPDAFVTRAQMAAMLARNLSGEAAMASTTAVSFADVAATHWAANEIEQARAAGIMNGLNSTVFAPEGSITRAQMATIAYRWMQQQANAEVTTGTASNVDATSTTTATGPATNATAAASFNDVPADLWAADAIAYVQSAGLMTGYQDGTFKPEGRLTRAEAVKVLNVLFKRTPLTGAGAPSFSDVPATHWAYADIEAAAQK